VSASARPLRFDTAPSADTRTRRDLLRRQCPYNIYNGRRRSGRHVGPHVGGSRT
jgi:hypothetical protein